MTTFQHDVNIKDHDGVTEGLRLAGVLVNLTGGDLNAVKPTVDISYEAGVATDSLLATIQLGVPGVKKIEVHISSNDQGTNLTSATASGALTAVTGAILNAPTAKKQVVCVTDADGLLVLQLVDSNNAAGQHFCVTLPTGDLVVGPASVAGDYEGG